MKLAWNKSMPFLGYNERHSMGVMYQYHLLPESPLLSMYPSRKNPNLRTTLKQIEKVLKAITI
jgi:hypothetical protein